MPPVFLACPDPFPHLAMQLLIVFYLDNFQLQLFLLVLVRLSFQDHIVLWLLLVAVLNPLQPHALFQCPPLTILIVSPGPIQQFFIAVVRTITGIPSVKI